MPASNEGLSFNDVATLVAGGELEWLGSAQSGTGMISHTEYNTYVRNAGTLANSSQLITYARAIANRTIGGGGGSPPPSPSHTASLLFTSNPESGYFDNGVSGGASGQQYSHECWCKRVASGVDQTIFARVTNPGPNEGWAFGVGSDNMYKFWTLSAGAITGTGNTGITSSGGWDYVSVQPLNGGSACTVRVIIGGVSYSAGFTMAVPIGGNELTIAHEPDIVALLDWEGYIDDVRVYNSVRDNTAMAADYQSATAGSGCVHHWRIESYTGTSLKTFPPTVGTVSLLADCGTSTDVPF